MWVRVTNTLYEIVIDIGGSRDWCARREGSRRGRRARDRRFLYALTSVACHVCPKQKDWGCLYTRLVIRMIMTALY